MKKFAFLLIFFSFLAGVAWGVDYTWNGSVNNAWETTGNWNPNGLPGASDTVTINSGNIHLNSPVTIETLIINSATPLSAGFSGSVLNATNLTLNGELNPGALNVINVTVTQSGLANGNINMNGSLLQVPSFPGTLIINPVNNNLGNIDAGTRPVTITIPNNSSNITIGNINTTGTITINVGDNCTGIEFENIEANGNIIINVGNGSAVSTGGIKSNGSVTITPGTGTTVEVESVVSTPSYNPPPGVTVGGGTTSNNEFKWTGVNTNWLNPANWLEDGAATTSTPPNNAKITIPSGCANYPVLTGTGTITCNSIEIVGGANIDLAGQNLVVSTANGLTNDGKIRLTGVSGQSISPSVINGGIVEFYGTGNTLAGITGFNNLIILNGTRTTTANLNVTGTLTNSGTLNIGGYNITANTITNTSGTIELTGAGSQAISQTTIDGTVVFSGNTNTSLAGLTGFTNLTINGGNRIANGNLNVTGITTISTGGLSTVANGSGSSLGTLSMTGGTLTLAGTETIASSTLSAGTVEINGGGTALPNITNYFNLTINGGTRTSTGFSVTNALTMNNNASLMMNGALSASTVTINSGASLTMGANLLTIGILNNAGTLTTTSGNISVSGNWNRTGAGSYSTTSGTVTFNNGAVVNNDNTFINVSVTGTVNFAGGSTQTINGTLNATGATLTSTTTSQWYLSGLTATNFNTNASTNISYCNSSNYLARTAANATNSGNNIRVFAGGPFTWTGGVNTDWENDGNWNTGYFPNPADNTTIIVIPNVPVTPNKLVLEVPVACATFTIGTNAEVDLGANSLTATTINNGGTLRLTGVAGQLGSITSLDGLVEFYSNEITIADITQFENLIISAGTRTSAGFNVTNALTISNTASLTTSGAISANALTINSGASLAMNANLLTIGTLDNEGALTTSGDIEVSGNSWSNNGTFTPGTGTVEFKGASTTVSGNNIFNNVTVTGTPITFSGSNTFNDLTVTGTVSVPIIVNFAGGSTQTINGTLSAAYSTLTSTANAYWYLVTTSPWTYLNSSTTFMWCSSNRPLGWTAGVNAIDGDNNNDVFDYTYTWDGSESTVWTDPLNWDKGVPPNNSINNKADIVIPTGLSNYPVLSEPVTCNSLEIESSDASIDLQGYSLTVTSASGLTNNGTIKLFGNSGQVTVNGAAPYSAGTPVTGTINYNGNLSPANWVFGAEYTNLIVDSTVTMANPGALDVSGNAEINSSISAASIEVSGNSKLGANVTINSNSQLYEAVELTGNVILTGATITTGAITGGNHDLTLNSSTNATIAGTTGTGIGKLTINGNAQTTGALTVAELEIANATSTLTLGDNNLTINNSLTNNGKILLVGTATQSITTTPPNTLTGTVEFNDTTGINLAGITQFTNLIISAGNRASAVPVTVNGELKIDSGAILAMNANTLEIDTLTNAGTLKTSGNVTVNGSSWDNSGTFEASSPSMVTFIDDATVSGHNKFYDVTVSANRIVQFANGDTQEIRLFHLEEGTIIRAIDSAMDSGDDEIHWILLGANGTNRTIVPVTSGSTLPTIWDCDAYPPQDLLDTTEANDGNNDPDTSNNVGVFFVAGNIYTWDGSESSDWSDPENWVGDKYPNPNDDGTIIIIPSSTPFPPVLDSGINSSVVKCYRITINTGARINLEGFDLNATAIINNGFIELIGNANQEIHHTIKPGIIDNGTVVFYGAGTDFAGIIDFHNLTINNGDRVASNDLTVAGDLQITGGSLNMSANDLTVTGTTTISAGSLDTATSGSNIDLGSLIMTGGELTLAGTETITSSTLSGGTVIFEGTNGTLAGITSFHNLTINDGDRVASSNLTVAGTTTINADSLKTGSLNTATSGPTSNLGTLIMTGGTLTLAGTETVTSTNLQAGTVIYTANNTTLALITDFYNLTISSGISQAPNDLIVRGNLSVSSGSLNMNTKDLIIYGDIDGAVSGIGELNLAAASGTQNIVFGAPATVGSLSKPNLGTAVIENALTVSGNVVISDGELEIKGDLILNGVSITSTAASLKLSNGSWTNNITTNLTSGKVVFENATVNGDNTFYDVTCIGTVLFEHSKTQTINNIFNIEDAILTATTVSPQEQWNLVTTATTPLNANIKTTDTTEISWCNSNRKLDLLDGTDAIDKDYNTNVFIYSHYLWIGAIDTLWKNRENWKPKDIPSIDIAVVIPTYDHNNDPITNYPELILGDNAECFSLEIEDEAIIDLVEYSLEIKDSLINNGTIMLYGIAGQVRITDNPSSLPYTQGTAVGGTIYYYDNTAAEWVFGYEYTNLTVAPGAVMVDVAGTLDVSGKTILNSDITSDNDQTYGSLELTAPVTLEGVKVTVNNVIDGSSGNNFNLTINGKTTGDADAILNGGSNIGALVIDGNAKFNAALLTADTVTVNGDAEINASVTADTTQDYLGDVTLGSTAVSPVVLTGTIITLGEITDGNGNDLTITDGASPGAVNAVLNGASNIGALFVEGNAEIKANITTTGNQSYNTVDLDNNDIIFTSSGGSITATGIIKEIVASGVVDLTVNASTGINLSAANTVSGNIKLNNSTSNAIVYNSELANSTDNLTITAVNNAATDGDITITEVTGNIVVDNIGLSGSGNVRLYSGINGSGDILINGEINSNRLTLDASDVGTITLNANITISSTNGTNHYDNDPDPDHNAAVYINASIFSGNGGIDLLGSTLNTGGWVCVDFYNTVNYTGSVSHDRIHYHPDPSKHIVYRSGVDPGSLLSGIFTAPDDEYIYIPADTWSGIVNISASNDRNVYIMDNPTGNGIANTRGVKFYTIDGAIEIWNEYYSSGKFDLNAGTGGIKLNNATIELSDDSFDTKGVELILIEEPAVSLVTENTIISTNDIIIKNISNTAAKDLTLKAANDITIDGDIDIKGNFKLDAENITTRNDKIEITGNTTFEAIDDITLNCDEFTGLGNLTIAADKISPIAGTYNIGAGLNITADNNIIMNGEYTITGNFVVTGITDPAINNIELNGDYEIDGNSALTANDIILNVATFSGTDDLIINNSGVFMLKEDSDITLTGAGKFEQNGTGGSSTLASNITTDTGSITFNDIVTVSGTTKLTTNGTTKANGNIIFNNVVNGAYTTNGVDIYGKTIYIYLGSLTLEAGAGQIDVRNRIGNDPDFLNNFNVISGVLVLAANIYAVNMVFDAKILTSENITLAIPEYMNGFNGSIAINDGEESNPVGTYSLTLSGGTYDPTDPGKNAFLFSQGSLTSEFSNLKIASSSYIKINGAFTFVNGSTLTLGAGKPPTTLDLTDMNDFAKFWNTVTLYLEGVSKEESSRVIVNTNTGDFLSNNDYITTGWAFIQTIEDEIEIDIDISTSVGSNIANQIANPRLILELHEGVKTKEFKTNVPIGSLYIYKPTELTECKDDTKNLSDTLTINGELLINQSNQATGTLNAGNHNIIMQAGLTGKRNLTNFIHDATDDIKYAGWEIKTDALLDGNNLPDNMNNFIFQQDAGKTVTFKRAEGTLDDASMPVFFEIVGNSMWQNFECAEPGATIQFSMHPYHHVFLGEVIIRSDDNNKPITLTRYLPSDKNDWVYIFDPASSHTPPDAEGGMSVIGLPSYPAPRDLKNSVEKEKFWNFNLITPPNADPDFVQIDLYNVHVYFSHAWYQSIPLPIGVEYLSIYPYYRESPKKGLFNYDWGFEFFTIIYSFAEDSDGNGRVDRIRVQSNVILNKNFTDFEVEVEKEIYNTPGSFRVVGDITNDPNDDASFYIYINEPPSIYDGKPLNWNIRKNNTLTDQVTKDVYIGRKDGFGKNNTTINTIPPRISYALTLPGHNETFFRFSQPVNPSEGRINGNLAPNPVDLSESYEEIIKYSGSNDLYPFRIQGALGYLFKIDQSPSINELAALPSVEDSAEASVNFTAEDFIGVSVRALDWNDEKVDKENFIYYPSPRYPKDWNYSAYETYMGNTGYENKNGEALTPDAAPDLQDTVFVPPFKALTPGMIKKLLNTGSVTPGDFNNQTDDDKKRRSTDVLVSMEHTLDNYFAWPVFATYAWQPDTDQSIIDNTTIRDFDGTKYFDAGKKIELHAELNSSFSAGALELFWTNKKLDAEMRLRKEMPVKGKNTGGLWQPDLKELGDDPLYSIPLRLASIPNDVRRETDIDGPQGQLFDYTINGNLESGDKVEFMFRVTGDASINSDMFIAYLEGGPIGEWYKRIRPFSFDIQNVRLQRGGVTIMNNVINPTKLVDGKREQTYLRYHLVRPGRVTIQVYTLDGSLVKSIRRNEQRPSGEWVDSWDGTNTGGREVARGMYFIRIVGPDIDEIRKVMVVK